MSLTSVKQSNIYKISFYKSKNKTFSFFIDSKWFHYFRALNNLERSDLYNLSCYKIIKIAFGKDEESKQLILDEDPIPKGQLINEEELKCFNLSLADDQKQAVMFALKRRHLAIIQGPPGTGKTTTLVELIRHLHSQNKKVTIFQTSF